MPTLYCFYFVVAVVGFEQLRYTASEASFTQEVCVQVFVPTPNEILSFDIFLAYETRTGTAGKFTIAMLMFMLLSLLTCR